MSKPNFDAYSPAQVADMIESIGVRKATMPLLQTLTLGVFIAFGAMLYTLVMSGETTLGFGVHRWLGGIAFSLGLVLVVIAGAELFTGNNLIVMAWAGRKIGTVALLRNWSLVYLGNFIGSIAAALLIIKSGTLSIGDPVTVEATAIAISRAKIALDPEQAIIRGILCNVLVCLAVWMCAASHRVSGKILSILFSIPAFVALGFEHSIANMYLIPVGMLADTGSIAWLALAGNLLPVTIGNIIGGGGFVAIVYLRGKGAGFSEN